MVKISLKYGAILGAVSIICTLSVASVHVIVKPIIIERTAQKVRDNLNLIYAKIAFDYKEITEESKLEKLADIDALYKVMIGADSVNYVYEMSPEGRNAQIVYLIAYDTLGVVKQIQYVQMRETTGRGDKIIQKEYLASIYQQNAAKMNVDLITGATYSTKAMKQSIETASNHLITEVLK